MTDGGVSRRRHPTGPACSTLEPLGRPGFLLATGRKGEVLSHGERSVLDVYLVGRDRRWSTERTVRSATRRFRRTKRAVRTSHGYTPFGGHRMRAYPAGRYDDRRGPSRLACASRDDTLDVNDRRADVSHGHAGLRCISEQIWWYRHTGAHSAEPLTWEADALQLSYSRIDHTEYRLCPLRLPPRRGPMASWAVLYGLNWWRTRLRRVRGMAMTCEGSRIKRTSGPRCSVWLKIRPVGIRGFS